MTTMASSMYNPGGNRCGGGWNQPPQQGPMSSGPNMGMGWPGMGGGWGMGGWNQMPWMNQQQGGWGPPQQNNGYSPQWNQNVNQLQKNGVIPFNTGQIRPTTYTAPLPQTLGPGSSFANNVAAGQGQLNLPTRAMGGPVGSSVGGALSGMGGLFGGGGGTMRENLGGLMRNMGMFG